MIAVAIAWIGIDKVGSWASVSHDKVVDRIDELLGDFEVKREDVGTQVEKLEKSVDGLRREQVKTEIQAEQLVAEETVLKEGLDELRAALETHRRLLDSKESAVLGGKTYTPDQLEVRAARLVRAYRQKQSRWKATNTSRLLLEKTAAALRETVDKRRAKVNELGNQLKEIDAKLIALDTLRSASDSAGEDGRSIASDFEEVEDEMDALYAKVEANLRVEESDRLSPSGQIETIDEIIEDTRPASSTADEIDRILGE
jgi:chromosome segregation ATPase